MSPFLYCFICFNIITKYVPGQNNSYACDPWLVNGRIYKGGNIKCEGHPFLNPDFIEGSVSISGSIFPDLMLNIDLSNQQLIMLIDDQKRAKQIIALSDAWIDYFNIGNDTFYCGKLEDTIKSYYQYYGNKALEIFILKSKILYFDNTTTPSMYRYTEVKNIIYLRKGGILCKVTGKHNFIKIFDKKKQKQIKIYLRHHRHFFKKPDLQQMKQFVDFYSDLS